MSEYLSKKAVLGSMNEQEKVYRGYGLHRQADTVKWWIVEIQSGAFDAPDDAPDEEIQRLHAELERIKANNVEVIRLSGAAAEKMQTEIERLRAALEEIRDHAIRFGLATVHMKAEKALSTTTEPSSPERVREEIKGLLEVWNFRGIAEQLENGYERGAVVELVELCEKLVDINAPKGDGNYA